MADGFSLNANGEIVFVFDEGGGVLTTGAKDFYIPVPYSGTIVAASIIKFNCSMPTG
jgi:hypothetical protein